MNRHTCDVCIVGAGTAGMAAAYALANHPSVRVILVDDNDLLGGTAVCSWVGTWIEGITPPYLQKIMREEFRLGQQQIDDAILPAAYGGRGGNIYMEAGKLAARYKKDMENAPNIQVFTGWRLRAITRMNASRKDPGRMDIQEIELTRRASGEGMRIDASYFIDSTGDGVLCRLACPAEGIDYYVGEDPYERFQEGLMKGNRKPADRTALNEPSLFYQIDEKADDDREILDSVKTVAIGANGEVMHPTYLTPDGYANRAFLNPMTGFGLSGYDVIVTPPDELYRTAVSRILEHWKYIKLSLQKDANKHKDTDFFHGYLYGQRTWNYTQRYASKLGIRESYRIACDYMVRQEDLARLIDPARLEHFIACGSHSIDFHVYGTLERQRVLEYNRSVVPSGIPYESLCPLKLANTWIACRAYGASHIALAARRVNKDMAQIGWAAGHAMRQCIRSGKTIREVDVEKIQSESGFKAAVLQLRSIYKNKRIGS